MKPFADLFSLPVPALAAVVVPQIDPDLLGGLPGWLATGLLGVWVTLWFLDRVGRLPGRPEGERRAHVFTTDDRKKLEFVADRVERLNHLFLFRGDDDGIERFPKFMQEARAADRETVELLRRANNSLERLIALQERRP